MLNACSITNNSEQRPLILLSQSSKTPLSSLPHQAHLSKQTPKTPKRHQTLNFAGGEAVPGLNPHPPHTTAPDHRVPRIDSRSVLQHQRSLRLLMDNGISNPPLPFCHQIYPKCTLYVCLITSVAPPDAPFSEQRAVSSISWLDDLTSFHNDLSRFPDSAIQRFTDLHL
ncbi:hypothetical protein BDP81DRAFT_432911, partial [Colletotrichum phormii]